MIGNRDLTGGISKALDDTYARLNASDLARKEAARTALLDNRYNAERLYRKGRDDLADTRYGAKTKLEADRYDDKTKLDAKRYEAKKIHSDLLFNQQQKDRLDETNYLNEAAKQTTANKPLNKRVDDISTMSRQKFNKLSPAEQAAEVDRVNKEFGIVTGDEAASADAMANLGTEYVRTRQRTPNEAIAAALQADPTNRYASKEGIKASMAGTNANAELLKQLRKEKADYAKLDAKGASTSSVASKAVKPSDFKSMYTALTGKTVLKDNKIPSNISKAFTEGMKNGYTPSEVVTKLKLDNGYTPGKSRWYWSDKKSSVKEGLFPAKTANKTNSDEIAALNKQIAELSGTSDYQGRSDKLFDAVASASKSNAVVTPTKPKTISADPVSVKEITNSRGKQVVEGVPKEVQELPLDKQKEYKESMNAFTKLKIKLEADALTKQRNAVVERNKTNENNVAHRKGLAPVQKELVGDAGMLNEYNKATTADERMAIIQRALNTKAAFKPGTSYVKDKYLNVIAK